MQHRISALVVGCMLAAAGANAQEPVRLRLAHTQPETDSQHVALVQFAKLVQERTAGQVRIEKTPD